MKKSMLFGVLIILLILNLSFVIAVGNETDDKAYDCLKEKVEDECSSLSPEARIFSLLAIGECKDEVLDDSNYETDIKSTAQAILALDKVGVDTTTAEAWLLSQNTTTSGIDWFLQIESTEATECTITNGGLHKVTIGENKKISSNAGACLILYGGDYWLKISSSPTLNCYTKEFEISCDKSFLTTLWYKKTTSDVIHVSANTHTASAGGTTTEKVNSLCFGTPCDYEASLWAALVLNFKGYDVSSFLPYLDTMKKENSQYIPESFLYSLTNQNNFRGDLLSKQSQIGGFWDVPGGEGKYYDTALALLPFQNEELTEKTNTINWLKEKQGTDGCWDGGNIRNTAFILYSIWPRGIIGEEDEGIDCEGAEYHCMSRMTCLDAEGDVLGDYSGCFGTDICCSKEKALEACSEQGGEVCGSGKECSTSTVEASDTSECCLGSCQTPSEKSECELYGDGDCRTSCYGNEEEAEAYECPSGKVCCVEKAVSEEKSYWWIWVLSGLIVLVVIGIIFKDKLRPYWFKIKSKFRKSKPGPRSGFPPPPGIPPQRVRPRRILPPAAQRQPRRRPITKKPRKEMEDVLKKLKEMGK